MRQVQEPETTTVAERYALRPLKTTAPEDKIIGGSILSSIGTLSQVLGSFPGVDEPTITLYLEFGVIALGIIFMIWGILERIVGGTRS